MKDYLCAFSSDARALYKADIYRVLALPNGSVVHFRYKKKYVDDKIANNPAIVLNQKILIFHTIGNSTPNSKNINHVPVRTGVITSSQYNSSTDIVHVYMRLDDFFFGQLCSSNSLQASPPKKFFTYQKVNGFVKDSFVNSVERLKSSFSGFTLFTIHGLYKSCDDVIKHKPISPILTNNGKGSRYRLKHGDEYWVSMSLGNPEGSDCKIEIVDSSSQLVVQFMNPVETTAQYDDYEFPIHVKSPETNKEFSLLSFIPKCKATSENDFSVQMELSLQLSKRRAMGFGMSFLGLSLSLIHI